MKKKASKQTTERKTNIKSKNLKQKIKQVVNVNIHTGRKGKGISKAKSSPAALGSAQRQNMTPSFIPSFAPSFAPVVSQPQSNSNLASISKSLEQLAAQSIIYNKPSTNETTPALKAVPPARKVNFEDISPRAKKEKNIFKRKVTVEPGEDVVKQIGGKTVTESMNDVSQYPAYSFYRDETPQQKKMTDKLMKASSPETSDSSVSSIGNTHTVIRRPRGRPKKILPIKQEPSSPVNEDIFHTPNTKVQQPEYIFSS
jgi:hypothetical protein